MESLAVFKLQRSCQLVAVSKYDMSPDIRCAMSFNGDNCDVTFKNAFFHYNFEDFLTELATAIAKYSPHLDFTCTAWWDDPDDWYMIELSIVYQDGVLRITRAGKCYMFRDEEICLDCGCDLSEHMEQQVFMCECCGATYAMSTADCDFDEIDHVFGGDDEIVTVINIRQESGDE